MEEVATTSQWSAQGRGAEMEFTAQLQVVQQGGGAKVLEAALATRGEPWASDAALRAAAAATFSKGNWRS